MNKIVLFFSLLFLVGCLNIPENNEEPKTAETSVNKEDYTPEKEDFCSGYDLKWSMPFYKPKVLKELFFSEQISDLSSLTKKEQVTRLNIGYTNLKELPVSLLECINLKELDISGNRFNNIDVVLETLSKLPNLKVLVFALLCFILYLLLKL